jgi:hypothetical protein
MSQYKSDILLCTEVCDPVPHKYALNGYYHVFTIGSYTLQEELRIGSDVSVQDNVSFLIQYADVHTFCVKVDSTVKFVLFGVKFHLASSFG